MPTYVERADKERRRRTCMGGISYRKTCLCKNTMQACMCIAQFAAKTITWVKVAVSAKRM